MFRVQVTGPAKRDIQSAHDWWRDNRSSEQAAKWFREIELAINSLSKMPRRCPRCRESFAIDREIRELLFGIGRRHTHRIIFTVGGQTVTVLRVRHTSQQNLRADELA
jgi:plasmid stabilization system protein ParE